MKKKTANLMALWYLHPRIALLLSLIFVNIVVIFLFTAILSIVSGAPFFSELAYMFTYTMSADGIYDFVNSQDDLTCFVIKVVLTVVQMIIFSGALIGFSTDVLQSAIDQRLNNTGKINLTNHMVFLNWSPIGANIIYDLSFLKGSKNIVILCEDDKEDVLTSIQNVFVENRKKMKNIRVFVKNGNTSSPKHLNDINLTKAKYIAVLLANHGEDEVSAMSGNDLNAFKSLLNIMNMSLDANIVVETEDAAVAKKMEQLLDTIDVNLKDRIIVFSRNGVLGRIMGRTIIDSAYSRIYHTLLSYDDCEFYGIAPMDVEEALYTYSDCIPVINYDDDDKIDENGNKEVDQLYVLADNRDNLGARAEKKSYVKPLSYKENIQRESFTLFAFSDTDDPTLVMHELQKYNELYNTNIKIHTYMYDDDMEEIVKEIQNCEGKKKIAFLSSSCTQNKDADIFMAALSLKLGARLDGVEMISEISNPSNFNSLKNIGVMSVIVSNKIISLFMLQLLTHPKSKKFYVDLISTNGDSDLDELDLDIIKVDNLLEFEGDTVTFSCKSELVQSLYIASNKTKMCIGIKTEQGEIKYLCDKMDEEIPLVLSKNDSFILVDYSDN